jgi:mannan endo-1,4-beta-mannosidase
MIAFSFKASNNKHVRTSYTVNDSQNRTSNPALLLITVKPPPPASILLFSFESGVEGWAPGNWQPNAGSVQQSSNFHTDGNYGLEIDSTGGGWFGAALPAPVDVTGKTRFKFDLQTTTAGTSREVALQFGDNWTWCEGGG